MEEVKTQPLDPDRLSDALGTVFSVTPPERARILCLVPSITELLCALGLAASLVGRTRYCIHPHDLLQLVPSVGGTKKVHMDQVLAVKPTHAILNIDENTREIAQQLAAVVPHLIVTHPQGPLDNPPLYRFLARVFDRAEAAEPLVGRFFEAHERLIKEATHWPARRVLYLIWKNPWMTVSPETYVAQTLALARLQTYPPTSLARYPTIDLASAADLEACLLSSEPYPFVERDVAELVGQCPALEGRVHLVDGEAFSWYGSRAIAGLDYLRGLVPRLWPA